MSDWRGSGVRARLFFNSWRDDNGRRGNNRFGSAFDHGWRDWWRRRRRRNRGDRSGFRRVGRGFQRLGQRNGFAFVEEGGAAFLALTLEALAQGRHDIVVE